MVPQGFISLRDSNLACRDPRADQDVRDTWLPQRWHGRYVQSIARTRYELTSLDGVMAVGVVNSTSSLFLWKIYLIAVDLRTAFLASTCKQERYRNGSPCRCTINMNPYNLSVNSN